MASSRRFASGISSILFGTMLILNLRGLPPLHAGEAAAPLVSTTIDFLDYCFYKTDPDTGYFTEQQYEEVIRAVSEAGFAKIYLRVDVCGVTLYPTTAGKQYAGAGATHTETEENRMPTNSRSRRPHLLGARTFSACAAPPCFRASAWPPPCSSEQRPRKRAALPHRSRCA